MGLRWIAGGVMNELLDLTSRSCSARRGEVHVFSSLYYSIARLQVNVHIYESIVSSR